MNDIEMKCVICGKPITSGSCCSDRCKKNDLEKQMGPEYFALFDALNNADENSQESILPMFDTLDETCPR